MGGTEGIWCGIGRHDLMPIAPSCCQCPTSLTVSFFPIWGEIVLKIHLQVAGPILGKSIGEGEATPSETAIPSHCPTVRNRQGQQTKGQAEVSWMTKNSTPKASLGLPTAGMASFGMSGNGEDGAQSEEARTAMIT